MQSPSPSVPFVEYVLKALEHPPNMFVSKLAACCTMLFLTRSDPDLLRSLCHKWAIRFAMDRGKLIEVLRRRSQLCKGQPQFCRHASIDAMDDTSKSGISLCDPDEAVAHFLRIVNSLVPTYFSWNWHKTDYVIQINKDYEVYVRLYILPICMATSAEDGIDDEEHSPWLLPPNACTPSGDHISGSIYSPNVPSEQKLRLSGGTAGAGAVSSVSTTSETSLPLHSLKSTPQAAPAPSVEEDVSTPLRASVGVKAYAPSASTHGLSSSHYTTPNSAGTSISLDSGLTFLTVGNFREALKRNDNGLVIIFHAQYSAKSNDALEVFQQIIQRRLLNPMPTIAVVHSVAEPELASAYNVSWFPTIIYTPPDPQRQNRLESPVKKQPQPTLVVDEVRRSPSRKSGMTDLATSGSVAPPLVVSNNHHLFQREACGGATTKSAAAAGSTSRPKNVYGSTLVEATPAAGTMQRVGPSPTEVLFGFSIPPEDACPSHVHHHPHHRSNSNAETPSIGLPGNSSSDSVQSLGDAGGIVSSIANDGHRIYPINGVVSVPALAEWLSAKGLRSPRVKRSKDCATKFGALRAEEKFKQFRELHSAVVMLRRLQGVNNDTPSSPDLGSRRNPEAPLFIFLGGGMAAGKSTAAMALAHSSWWKNHKDQSVLVNADEFKVAHPHFASQPDSSLHTRSTRAAESLLVQAVNQGRSIVFDGTMMWAPFVLQVIEMVRHAHTTLYKQGLGYKKEEGIEQYFLPSESRPTPLSKPYQIRFLGITVEPEIAVPRGFMRKFSTGRGVPISTQLLSFKLFSENFPLYASLVDSATLYNNNIFVDLNMGELPPVLAQRDTSTGAELQVFNEAAYQLFLKQRTLNEHADNIFELYPTSNSNN